MSQTKQDDRIEVQRALALSRLALDKVASECSNKQGAEFRELYKARKVINRLARQYGGYEIRRED